MFTKTALTAAIILGTASVALATEQDPNLANRYASFQAPAAAKVIKSATVALQTRNVALRTSKVALKTSKVALRTNKAVIVKTHDRAGAIHGL
jgi:hypothetical protein